MKNRVADHPICEVRNLTFAYENYTETSQKNIAEPILQDITFSVEEGEYVLICGETGCGKSTLLKLLKKELSPAGRMSGQILLKGKPLEEWDDRASAAYAGFVMQNPNDQCVTDQVWHELSFGLENLGTEPDVIRRRVAEIAAYFGIDDWYDKKVEELSGGQKQLLNLAAVMVMDPKILLLDEPTAQLDPIAAGEFLHMLKKLNQEFGITVIIAEHRLEEPFAAADRVLRMEKGRAGAVYKTPRAMLEELSEDMGIYQAMPESVKQLKALSIAEARADIRHMLWERGKTAETMSESSDAGNSQKTVRHKDDRGEAVLSLKDIWFRYGKKEADVLQGLSLELYAGEILCLLGNNGSGKTTLLKLISGMEEMQEGRIHIKGCNKASDRIMKIGYLPQDVETLFVTESVEQELALVGEKPDDELCAKTHPYDLSGGEKQLLGMKKVLTGGKEILLLDEPTKGLDASAKEKLCRRIMGEREKGTAVLMITHDPEFAVSCADRCGLLFRGKLVCVSKTREFFRENCFYTTAAARIARGFWDDVVTGEDLHTRLEKLQRG